MANFLDLGVLVNARVDFLLLVEETVVIRVEEEDERNLDKVDDGKVAVFFEFEFVESKLAGFFLVA